MWRGRRNDSADHVTSSEWCVSKTRRTLLGYIGMGGFQATTFTVISSLLAFIKVGCASAQRSGLAKTRTMGACGRRFAAHRGIESVSISVTQWRRAERAIVGTQPCHCFEVLGEAVFFDRFLTHGHCFSEDSETVAHPTLLRSLKQGHPARDAPE